MATAEIERKVWDYLKAHGFTDAGTAGCMGNMYAESGLRSDVAETAKIKPHGWTSEQYTKMVDDGSYTNFANDSIGYGIVQFTWVTYKQDLLNLAKERKVSIGDLDMQMDCLILVLEKYSKEVLKIMQTTNDVLTASNTFLLQFERPADQSLAMQQRRYGFSQGYYDKYAGTGPATGTATGTAVNYSVKVTASAGLNCRKSPVSGAIVLTYPCDTVLTITQEASGWGYTGKGWICLQYTRRVDAVAAPPSFSSVPGSDSEQGNKGDDTMLSYDKFKGYMNQYRKELQTNEAGDWSKEAREWAIRVGLLQGSGTLPDGSPNYMYADWATREALITILYRFAQLKGLI